MLILEGILLIILIPFWFPLLLLAIVFFILLLFAGLLLLMFLLFLILCLVVGILKNLFNIHTQLTATRKSVLTEFGNIPWWRLIRLIFKRFRNRQ